mgnify:CR=1 FL=1|jgi:hypothetical protein
MQYNAYGFIENSSSKGIRFNGSSFFSGIRTPIIPEYIGIVYLFLFESSLYENPTSVIYFPNGSVESGFITDPGNAPIKALIGVIDATS